jgi:hypothetical protein
MRLGRESVIQVQNSLRYVDIEFLSVASEAGELEKTTHIRVFEARDLIRFCRVDPDLISRYIELQHDEYNKQMRQRKLKRVLSRTSSTSKNSESVSASVTDRSGEVASDFKEYVDEKVALDMDKFDEIQSITGERMDDSHHNLVKEDDNKKNDIDRNMELVSLLKTKTTSKKRKHRENADSDEVNAGRSTMTKERSIVKKVEKKKKSKKKKRNDGKCVIDDIFDGF